MLTYYAALPVSFKNKDGSRDSSVSQCSD